MIAKIVYGQNVTWSQRFDDWARRSNIGPGFFFLAGFITIMPAISAALSSEHDLELQWILLFFVGIVSLICGGRIWSHKRERRRFLNEKGPFRHPTLGDLHPDCNSYGLSDYPHLIDWYSEWVSVSFGKSPIEVFLNGGSEDGPSETALSGYEWIESNWPEALRIIEDKAFDFYGTYDVDGVPEFDEPKQIWGSEVLISLSVSSKDNFNISMRFTWQTDRNPHEITFYVDDGECTSYSVDG